MDTVNQPATRQREGERERLPGKRIQLMMAEDGAKEREVSQM